MKKPIKSTVYLPVKILEDIKTGIIVKYVNSGHKYPVKEQSLFIFTPEQLNEYTQAVIKQALETAAEKSKVDYYKVLADDPKEGDDAYISFPTVDKQSITNTFEETFKLFKNE